MMREMMNRVLAVVRDEQGIETLEWIAMAFVIITLVVIVAYPAGLPAAIATVVGNITAAL